MHTPHSKVTPQGDMIFGSENPFRPSFKLYLRYIDDLLVVMEDGVAYLASFLVFLNSSNNKNLSFYGTGR